jgi:aryl-alcohol dehydrogenase-like predicted oxidoreductase
MTTMAHAQLGDCGLRLSRIGLGMMSYGDPAAQSWALSEDQAEPIVRQAAELGITFFDTADMYSDGVSEEITGRLLGKLFARREDYVLATKVYYPVGPGPNDRGLSRAHIMSAIDASLRRLGTDYVDLYQIHRWDERTPIAETMAALRDVVRAGKARYLGASTMRAWQFAKAQHTAVTAGGTAFVSMQNRYSLANRDDEREMIPLCLDQGVGLLPYSPLARGLLAGKRRPGAARDSARSQQDQHQYRPADYDVADAVAAVATELSRPPAQVALAWLLGRPGVTAPIIGATSPRHLTHAVAALDLTLTDAQRARLEAPYAPHPDGAHA